MTTKKTKPLIDVDKLFEQEQKRLEREQRKREETINPFGGDSKVPDADDIEVKQTQGSTAGAGSGDFHVYKNQRRNELARLSRMEREKRARDAQSEFEARRAAVKAAEAQRTAKKAAKRKRMKEKQRKAKQRKAGTAPVAGPARVSDDDDNADADADADANTSASANANANANADNSNNSNGHDDENDGD